MKIIAIDAGHGGHDPGARYRAFLEKDLCLQLAYRLERSLSVRGHRPVMSRGEDIYLSPGARASWANTVDADLFVSLHCNADPDEDLAGMPEASGAEIWIYPGSPKSAKLAYCVGETLRATFPDEPWRGIKESAHLAVLRLTHMPAVLIETGFIDNSSTVRRLSDPRVQDELAGAITDGLEAYLNWPAEEGRFHGA